MFSKLLPELYGIYHLDIAFPDILAAHWNTLWPWQRINIQDELEKYIGDGKCALASLCVRSAFDLYLQVSKFKPGSEIIFTSLNISDMVAIARHHGLIVRSVDLELNTLAPSLDQVRKVFTEHTVVLLVAYIYSRRSDISDIVEFAHSKNVAVIEDCAQAFRGPSNICNHKSDLAFYSFGTIKYNTCFGGAITYVKDKELFRNMKAKQATYNIQSSWTYWKKLLKYTLLIIVMNNPRIAWPLRIFDLVGISYLTLFQKLMKAFNNDIFTEIRYQPCYSLLTLMLRRMVNYDKRTPQQIVYKGDLMHRLINTKKTFIPGMFASDRSYWLCPVIVDNPKEVAGQLYTARYGIGAFASATQILVIRDEVLDSDSCRINELKEDISTSDRLPYFGSCAYSTHTKKDKLMKNTQFLVDHVLYLPLHAQVSDNYIKYVCRVFNHVVSQRKSIYLIAEEHGINLGQNVLSSGPLSKM